jgi:hypothetical protein
VSKLLTTLLLASLAALGVYAARRRILYALKTGAIVYVVLLFARLLLSLVTGGAQSEHVDELVWPTLILAIVWAVLWWVSTAYAQRRERQKKLRRAAGVVRPGR